MLIRNWRKLAYSNSQCMVWKGRRHIVGTGNKIHAFDWWCSILVKVVNVLPARRETWPPNILAIKGVEQIRAYLMTLDVDVFKVEKTKLPVPVYINYIFKSVSVT